MVTTARLMTVGMASVRLGIRNPGKILNGSFVVGMHYIPNISLSDLSVILAVGV